MDPITKIPKRWTSARVKRVGGKLQIEMTNPVARRRKKTAAKKARPKARPRAKAKKRSGGKKRK